MERLVLRISPSLRELLETRAKVNGRSMNAEAASILEHALDGSPATLIQRALQQHWRASRAINATQKRQQDLVARRDAMRAALIELMPDERAADSMIRLYENERSQYEAASHADLPLDEMTG